MPHPSCSIALAFPRPVPVPIGEIVAPGVWHQQRDVSGVESTHHRGQDGAAWGMAVAGGHPKPLSRESILLALVGFLGSY